MEHADLVVVGAGPAGASAAWSVASAGAKVILLDKQKLPRYKTCGGGLTPRAMQSLPAGFNPPVEATCNQIQLHLHGRHKSLSFQENQSPVRMCMRDNLDHQLTLHAQSAGVILWEKCAIQGLFQENGSVRVQTPRGEIRARALFAADGASSPAATMADFPDNRHMAPALEWEIEVPDSIFRRLGSAARFDFGVNVDGYAWVFPKQAHLSVGILSTRKSQTLQADMQRYLRLLGIDSIRRVVRHGYVIPLSPRSVVAKEGVLLLGDAAGFADPVTAEGIGPALRSGRLAAQSFLAGGDIAQRYRQALYNQTLPDLRIARMLAVLLYQWPAPRRLAFAWKGQSLCRLMGRVIAGECDYKTAAREMLAGGLKFWR